MVHRSGIEEASRFEGLQELSCTIYASSLEDFRGAMSYRGIVTDSHGEVVGYLRFSPEVLTLHEERTA